MTLAPDGFFYGTTASSDIYRISPEGAFSLVRQFEPPGGEPDNLMAALVLGSDGWFYSTSPRFDLLVLRDGGTFFRVTPAGDAEVLRRFFVLSTPVGTPFSPEGVFPRGEPAEGPDGEFYGANRYAGRTSATGERSCDFSPMARWRFSSRSRRVPASRTQTAPARRRA